MDDAFAGGVCRCMYCGTIQTVPSVLKNSRTTATATTAKPQVAKAIFKQELHPPRPGSGLDDLAGAVGGSGLAGSGLSEPRLRAQTIAPVQQRSRPFILAGSAIAGLLLLVSVLWVWRANEANPARSAASATAPASVPRAAPGEPSFCGVPIHERVVIYVLDRGSATGELFADLKDACYRSIESLGPQRRFQIIFWNNGSQVAFPEGEPVIATPENLDAARAALEDVGAHGQSEARSALTKAFTVTPGAIVLATAKGYELDDSFVRMVDSVRRGGKARIYTFALGSGEPGSALKTIASRTGGQFRVISASTLREHARSP
jgi:hypothetical protein